MSKVSRFLFRLAIAMGSGLILASHGTASAQANEDSSVNSLLNRQESDSFVTSDQLSQVSSVSQLGDVKPTDWAFSALQSLVERYGVIAGYPDRTYRGTRSLSRYEFAAGLNAALDKINELLSSGLADKVSKEDLETVQRLQGEFAAELATLKGQVDKLEAKTATLESLQFSTTTKLSGEVSTYIAGVAAGDNPNGRSAQSNTAVGARARLIFDSSFTGKDQFRIRLVATTGVDFGGRNSGVLGTNEGRPDLGGSASQVGQLRVDTVRYRFPIGDSTTVWVYGATDGYGFAGFAPKFNPIFDSDRGAISRFAKRNANFYYSGGGAGFAFTQRFSPNLAFDFGYFAANGGDPREGNGIFSGKYQALGTLYYTTPDFILGLSYSNTYSPAAATFGSGTGSNAANSNGGGAVVANTYGLQGSWRIAKNLALAGWVGYANHRYLGKGDASVWNWLVGVAFPDLFKEGNLGGILVGQEPKVTSVSPGVDLGLGLGQADRDTSLHIETFYTLRISRNISITPGLIWITAPNSDARNRASLIGSVRAALTF